MKIAKQVAVVVLSSLSFSSMVMADNDAVMTAALQQTTAHQQELGALRAEIELLEKKERISELVKSCKKNGMTCYPTARPSLNMELLNEDGKPTAVASAPDGIVVPDMAGLQGDLIGEVLEPGDEGYDPAFDPNRSYMQPAGADDGQAPLSAIPTQDEIDEMMAMAPMPDMMPEQGVAPSVMPELLGVENDEAIFFIGGREVRAKGGQYLPGDEWKVRDVSFDNVWLKGPDGKSERVYINWR